MDIHYISFENAKLAKTHGYPQLHYPCYANDGKIHTTAYFYNSKIDDEPFYATTQSLLQKWLRDEKQYYITIEVDQTTYPKFCFSISKFHGNPNDLTEQEWYWENIKINEFQTYRKYEDALEEALFYTLNLL